MSTEKKKHQDRRKRRAAEIANTFEWLITAFILAFIFRAFVMEAFRIPTGSMADTLKGAHFRLRCRQCGYEYDYGFVPEKYRLPRDSMPHGPLRMYPARCPSCGFYQKTGGSMPVAGGDRILVLKCIYQFFEPRRWDVVVFKNPLEPSINYIKRLVGLPKETVEIIDGDIYINGLIARKPPRVQQELWMPVYDNDYQPVLPSQGQFNGHPWQCPLTNTAGSDWQIDPADPTRFRLDAGDGDVHTMTYRTDIGNDFRATYAYDDVRTYRFMPYCSDLMVRFCVTTGRTDGLIGINLGKYGRTYRGRVDFSGRMAITEVSDGTESPLDSMAMPPIQTGRPIKVQFANVDHRLTLQVGRTKLSYDLGRGPDDAGPRKTDIEPQVGIFGSGRIVLSHVAIFRDIHYTSTKYGEGSDRGRATEGNPLVLGEDEFFVLGDNSPNSEDGRWWSSPGKGNNGKTYRAGIVPRDYLVGKAVFVYWPSGFRPFDRFPFAAVPNVGKMRFIHGGR